MPPLTAPVRRPSSTAADVPSPAPAPSHAPRTNAPPTRERPQPPAAPHARLAAWLQAHRRIVVLTGAGVSTASGIPDFRSAGGIWTRYDPRRFTFSRYVASQEVRAEAWRMRRELWGQRTRPNAAHRAVTELERTGRAVGVVTQNIDGLHSDAGARAVIELHGSARRVCCIGSRPRKGTPQGCGFAAPADWALARLEAGEVDPRCPDCGGIMKSATVSFGQNVDPATLQRARDRVHAAEAVLALGSSLRVQPAASLPAQAADRGVPLAIVNREPTPLDERADLVAHGAVEHLLPAAVAARDDTAGQQPTRPAAGATGRRQSHEA